jgi:hypothetical protein
LNVIASPSPRISGRALDFEDVEGLTVRNVSRNVCIRNVPGASAVGMERKDSRGDTASVLADRRPYLSQLRYLEMLLATILQVRYE